MPFTEDLDAFLDDEDFAFAATLQGGTTGGVGVLFDEEHLDAFGQVSTTNPACLAKASAIVAGDVGTKTLTINSVAYNIRDRQPVDDGSFIRVQLEKV